MKKQTKELDALSVAWLRNFYMAVLLCILVIPFWPKGGITTMFMVATLLRTVLDTGASILLVRSFKHGDLSLVMPILGLTPVLIVGVEAVLTQSTPSLLGWAGVIVVAIGLYFLYNKKGAGPLSPLRAMRDNPGSIAMLWVAGIWSLTSVLHRIAIKETNTFFYGGMSSVLLAVSVTLVVAVWGKVSLTTLLRVANNPGSGKAGFLAALTWISQVVAQGGALASYVIAVKRSSILFSSILGALVLGEKIEKRVLPILAVVTGIVLLALS